MNLNDDIALLALKYRTNAEALLRIACIDLKNSKSTNENLIEKNKLERDKLTFIIKCRDISRYNDPDKFNIRCKEFLYGT